MEPTYSSQSRRMLSDDDRYRPRYHYTSPANFLGDPNGPLLWDGRYHLFYQYNPDGAYDNSRRMHWGHAVSDDLVRWTDLPIALGPDPDGPDRLGCFSGAATVWDGVPTLVYYGNPTGICIATSADGLLTWQKHPANPVIPHSLHGGPTVFDPAIWREDGTWYCLSGGSVEGPKDAAFLFRSEDMVDWEYVGLFYEPGDETDCAVPDFFALGDKHVLLFSSHQKGVQYYIGEYTRGRFEPVRHGRMNSGSMGLETGNLLAAYTLLDGSGRRVMFGWVSEGRQEEVQRGFGWSGTMCLPRVLSLAPDGLLQQEPIDEVRSLRREHVRVADVTVADGSVKAVPDAGGDCLEIAVAVDVGTARDFGVKVLCSPDETEQTVISYSRESSTLSLDVEKCSLDHTVVGREAQSAQLDLDEGEPLRLRVFVDRSIVEVFANRGVCLTKRVYPVRADSTGIRLFANGGDVVVRSLETWRMDTIW